MLEESEKEDNMHGIISSRRLKRISERLRDETISTSEAACVVSDLSLTARRSEGRDQKQFRLSDEVRYITRYQKHLKAIRKLVDKVCMD